MKYLILLLTILLLVSCGFYTQTCVKQAMFFDNNDTRPTGLTSEQAMKICGVK